jgi:uncharacterized protein (UPF0332 family)
MIWDSFIDLAGSLVGQESEAAKRSAVSRAYYGAFNAARRLLEAHGIPIDNHRAHDRVWRTFKDAGRATSETEKRWQMVGDLGGTLRVLRNQADYADLVPRLDREAEDAVVASRRILDLLDELEFS